VVRTWSAHEGEWKIQKQGKEDEQMQVQPSFQQAGWQARREMARQERDSQAALCQLGRMARPNERPSSRPKTKAKGQGQRARPKHKAEQARAKAWAGNGEHEVGGQHQTQHEAHKAPGCLASKHSLAVLLPGVQALPGWLARVG